MLQDINDNGERADTSVEIRREAVPQLKKAPYPECQKCPFWQYQECLIQSSRILTYFYCPVSEGYQTSYYTSSRRNGRSALVHASAD